MKFTFALALAGLAAAAPTATKEFGGAEESPLHRPSGRLYDPLASLRSKYPYVKGSHEIAVPLTATTGPSDGIQKDHHHFIKPQFEAVMDPATANPMITDVPLFDASLIQPRAEPTSPAAPEETVAALDMDLEEFEDSGFYSRLAQDETAPYPYERVFSDHNATAIHQPIEAYTFDSYDANRCAQHCNEHRACRSFAVFVERLPSCTTDCEDPEAWEANVCELYNTPLEHGVVTDGSRELSVDGEPFTRAVRASNGYNKVGPGVVVTAVQTVTVTVSVSVTATLRETVSSHAVHDTSVVTHSAQPVTTTATVTVTVADPASVRTETTTATVTASASQSWLIDLLTWESEDTSGESSDEE